MMYFNAFVKYFFILMISFAVQALGHTNEKGYEVLQKEVLHAPSVVGFFSFYCGACYLFSDTYQIDCSISNSLPEKIKLTKYHVADMGKLGNELTIAWSIANILNIQDRVEKLLFARVRNNTLNTNEDIKSVFLELGINSNYYDSLKESDNVQFLTKKQHEAVKDFQVISTPSFYILGKYKINNNEIKAKDVIDFQLKISNLVNKLLKNEF